MVVTRKFGKLIRERAGLVGILGKLLLIALMLEAFTICRFLLESPTNPLFASFGNGNHR